MSEELKLVPTQATEAMCRAAVVYANGNAVYKTVAEGVLKIEESIYAEVYEAMLAASPPPPEDGWMPIESGPKDDSTRVLVSRLGYAEDMAVCWWSAHFEQWVTANGGAVFHGATHYRSLPPPPAALEPKEQHE